MPKKAKAKAAAKHPKTQVKKKGILANLRDKVIGAKAPAPAPASKKLLPKTKPESKTQLKMETRAAPLPAKQKPSRASKGTLDEQICREAGCDALCTSAGYCRLHYIKNWKKIKRRELVLKEGKLNQYIEELVSKYPEKYIEAIRNDLASDKEFGKVIHELELDESIDDFDADAESIDTLIDSIRRDIDDEGESF